jgi:hypothetical protein
MTALDREDGTGGDVDGITRFLQPPGDNRLNNGARFGSQSSWDQFTHWRWVAVRDQAHGFPF